MSKRDKHDEPDDLIVTAWELADSEILRYTEISIEERGKGNETEADLSTAMINHWLDYRFSHKRDDIADEDEVKRTQGSLT